MAKSSSLAWLAQAKNDLAWTEANIVEKIYYGACYTSQQAAEKALKSYLASRNKLVRKIHDLGALLEECKRLDPSFGELKEACVSLTDYYLETRYPDIGEFLEYTETEAKGALQSSKKIVDFVESKLRR